MGTSSAVQADSRKPQATGIAEQIAVQGSDAVAPLREKLQCLIRDAAYYQYEQDGNQHGRDVDHWTGAEARFCSANVEIRDSGPWFHCNFPVRGIAAGNVQVAIDPEQLVIYLGGEQPGGPPADGSIPVYYQARWPQAVEPATAAAYVKEELLTIEVKKAEPATQTFEATIPIMTDSQPKE